jgi:hypothetical protein
MNEMSDDRRGGHGPQERPRRPAVTLTLVTMLAAGLAAACGASAPAAPAQAAGPPTYQQMLAYVQCIREHGYPTEGNPVQGPAGLVFPPNAPPGPLPLTLQAAQTACQQLRPRGGGLSDPQGRAKALAQAEQLSRCMRAHGIADFPDPVSSPHMIGFPTLPPAAETASPQYQAAQRACARILPGSGGGHS